LACQNGHLQVVNLLLGLKYRGIDPAANDNRAFIMAWHFEIVKLLLGLEGRGIDPSYRGMPRRAS